MALSCLANITKDCGIDMHPEEVKLIRQALMNMLVGLRLNETNEPTQNLIRSLLTKIK